MNLGIGIKNETQTLEWLHRRFVDECMDENFSLLLLHARTEVHLHTACSRGRARLAARLSWT